MKPLCPKCGSNNIIYYGRNACNKQIYKCKECGRQFVENPRKSKIAEEKKETIKKLVLEKISLAGIARAVSVSKSWLQIFVNDLCKNVQKSVNNIKQKVRLIMECDEMWAFVGSKKNPKWIWFALNRDTREILGVYIGDRSKESAKKFWDSLPDAYKQYGIAFCDQLAAYAAAFPPNQLYQCEKSTGATSHIERFNLTVRQRVSRLVRKSLAFAKKEENLLGSIWMFVHSYNENIKNKC